MVKLRDKLFKVCLTEVTNNRCVKKTAERVCTSLWIKGMSRWLCDSWFFCRCCLTWMIFSNKWGCQAMMIRDQSWLFESLTRSHGDNNIMTTTGKQTDDWKSGRIRLCFLQQSMAYSLRKESFGHDTMIRWSEREFLEEETSGHTMPYTLSLPGDVSCFFVYFLLLLRRQKFWFFFLRRREITSPSNRTADNRFYPFFFRHFFFAWQFERCFTIIPRMSLSCSRQEDPVKLQHRILICLRDLIMTSNLKFVSRNEA